MTPQFDDNGNDEQTFAPFILKDCRNTEWKDVRLSFSDWDWLHDKAGDDSIDDYCLNGYGVEGLVMAARLLNGLDPDTPAMDFNSEADTCYIHFTDFDEAVRTAEVSARMINDLELLHQAVATAVEHEFGD